MELEAGQTLRVSGGGKIEDAIVQIGGHSHVRQRLLRTSKVDNLGNTIYVVLRIAPHAGTPAAESAEDMLLNAKAR